MSLILLIHHGCCSLEAVPDVFAVLLAHGAVLLPLLVVLLELLESLDHIIALRKSLCLLAEGNLGFQVLAEIKVAQVAVDLYHIVELLDLELV